MTEANVTTTKNQQKLVHRGRCYTLKTTNRNDKYWVCTEVSRIVSIYNVIIILILQASHFCSNLEIKRLPWHTVHKSGGHRSHPLTHEHAERCPVNPPHSTINSSLPS
ncbi:hypothetical protein T07_4108 [Trichinella nelsoni]|uniref:FLYWCH-type domain-containing protein n=1 Tax=Trichinella nelsoni TaxID=6336 RepID=A0A0V0RFP5_9BILA|nr:hypothetical protein T07_7338 [Trichinella nelsoni]KRX13348.1 hypothetical protein T07_4108 [Trichinella nelsoni]